MKLNQFPSHVIDGEYIKDWLVLGPFFPDDLHRDFFADVSGESNIEPKAGDTVTTSDGRILTWRRFNSKTPIINLLDSIGHHENVIAYVFCILQSDVDGDFEIYLDGEDWMAVWINGKQVRSNPIDSPPTRISCVFEVTLKVGANLCYIRVSNAHPARIPKEVDMDLCFGMLVSTLHASRGVVSGVITDGKGQPLANASVCLEQDGEIVAQTLTDTSGSYRINVYPARGTYDLSATSSELGNWLSGIYLSEGERQKLNLSLKETLSIEGKLLTLDGSTQHIAVPVQVCSGKKVIATTLSDDKGSYRFINLKPSMYQVRCQTMDGYIYLQSEVKIERGKPLRNIDFRFAPFKKGIWKNYTCIHGLPHNWVETIYRDPSGMMWLGTVGGVSRYDGKRFVNFTTEDGLADNDVHAIHQDNDGVMWFGTFSGGVSRYIPPHSPLVKGGSKGGFVSFTTKDGLANNRVRAIHQGSDGVIWFGTAGGISRYIPPHSPLVKGGSKGGFVNLTTKDGLVNNDIRAIYQDTDGVMWFGTTLGVSRYDARGMPIFLEKSSCEERPSPVGDSPHFIHFTTKDGLVNNCVAAINRDSDGALWFGTAGGVSRYIPPHSPLNKGSKGEFVNFTTKDGLANNYVTSIYQDSDGAMWFGTLGGCSRYDGNGFVNFTTKDGLVNNAVHAIHQGSDGVMWFGTGDGSGNGGLSRYDGNGFVNFTTKDGLENNYIFAIQQDSDGVMWFGSQGVNRYDGKNFVNPIPEDELANTFVRAIHRDPDGVLWIGTVSIDAVNVGVFKYDGEKLVKLTTKDGLADNIIASIHRDPDGTMWFGTWGGGVSRYIPAHSPLNKRRSKGRFENFTTKDGLANNVVRAIYRDSNGIMWLGTYNGVSRYDGKEFINFTTKDGLAGNQVVAIHQDQDGVIWFGTEIGVSRYIPSHSPLVKEGSKGEVVNFTTKDGLAGSVVHAICRDTDGVIWFGIWGGGGVSLYDGASWSSLDTRDGLAGNSVLSILQDSNGYLWFGTDEGVTRYRRNNIPPKVQIVSVTTDQTYRDFNAIPQFVIGTRVTVEYNAIDFKTIPEKRQYRCRIREMDSAWRDPTKATSFDCIFDKPGTYTFEVQSIDRDLNYSQPAAVALTIQPDPLIVALQNEVHHLRREVSRKYHFSNIIGRTVAIRQVYALMEKAIDSGLTVLITGETGTGKEMVAKAIHFNSPRREKPLKEYNCGAFPKELIASELFGHRKGAFTGANEDKMGLFEAASGGTVLLDEVGEMPQDAQIHLLRVLQERKVQRIGENQLRDVDVRIIAITNRDLTTDVKAVRFRQDLYYRLSVFPIHVPPLRERLDDIPLLVEHFLKKTCDQQNKEIEGFAPDVMGMLRSYPWPGNVRELENEISRAAALVESGSYIQAYHFSTRVTRGESLIEEILSEQLGLNESLDRFRRRLIEEALRESGGNRSEAARRLGIDRSNLRAMMKRMKIK